MLSIDELRKRAEDGLALSPKALAAIKEADARDAEHKGLSAQEREAAVHAYAEALQEYDLTAEAYINLMRRVVNSTEALRVSRERAATAARVCRRNGDPAMSPEEISAKANRSKQVELRRLLRDFNAATRSTI